MKFKNYKYDLITIKVFDQDEFDKIQKLLHGYNFVWDYSDNIKKRTMYGGEYNTIYVVFKTPDTQYSKYHTMVYAPNFSLLYANQFNYDKTTYTIIDCDKIKCIIEHGQIQPSYKPKKIKRTI